MKVRNLKGTSDNICKCGSWLKHWENYSRQTTKQCVVSGCRNQPEVGGHVQKENFLDQNWYIIPICKVCNAKHGQGLQINDKVNLVSANVSETCGK